MNEPCRAFGCDLIMLSSLYLTNRQIKRVARPKDCNYERCVFVTLFFCDERYGSIDYK